MSLKILRFNYAFLNYLWKKLLYFVYIKSKILFTSSINSALRGKKKFCCKNKGYVHISHNFRPLIPLKKTFRPEKYRCLIIVSIFFIFMHFFHIFLMFYESCLSILLFKWLTDANLYIYIERKLQLLHWWW